MQSRTGSTVTKMVGRSYVGARVAVMMIFVVGKDERAKRK